jgi:hypothetical protein
LEQTQTIKRNLKDQVGRECVSEWRAAVVEIGGEVWEREKSRAVTG